MKKISLHTATLLRNLPIIFFPLLFIAREIEMLSTVLFIVVALVEVGALMLYGFLKKESADEMAEKALSKADAICFKLLELLLILSAVVFLRDYEPIIQNFGWIIATALAAVTLANLLMFYYFDKKGS